jgi:hypothetical protein
MSEEKPQPLAYASVQLPRRRAWWKLTLMILAEAALIVTLIFVIWATLLPTLKGPSPDVQQRGASRGGRGNLQR